MIKRRSLPKQRSSPVCWRERLARAKIKANAFEHLSLIWIPIIISNKYKREIMCTSVTLAPARGIILIMKFYQKKLKIILKLYNKN